ncbi:MAG: hypothetical protein JRD89_00200 [Deltaproteobacteria bacterium]|nr:hypothetical protein [Deltaproteobacteria bacterium]
MPEQVDLDAILQRINTDLQRKYGKPLLRRASEHSDIHRIPTGIIGLDKALRGGIPVGIPVIVQGRESTGKSSLCYHIAGQAHEHLNKPVLLVYAEGPFDSQYEWARDCGLPVDDTLVLDRSLALEDALQIVREQLQTGLYSCIIVDSLASLRPSPEVQKKLEEAQSHGVKAVIMNRFFNSLTSFMPDEPPLLLFTQHLYDNPGFGGPQMTGGRGQQYIAGLIIRLSRLETLTVTIEHGGVEHKKAYAIAIQWEIIKSKVAPAIGERGRFDLYLESHVFPRGTFSEHVEALRRAILCGLVTRRGSWYEYKGEKYQGEAAILRVLDVQEAFDAYYEALGKVISG